MASANVELVRSIYADWEQGDFGSAEWADRDIEFVIADGPTPGCWRGLDAMAAVMRDLLSVWLDFRAEAEALREIDGERVLGLAYNRGRGKASGVEIGYMRGKAANLFHLHEGKVTRFVLYYDRDRALDELGLAPEIDSATH